MITKLSMRDFMFSVRRWMERHPEIEPISKPALFQCVAADCYPAEPYERLMAIIAETEASSRIENAIRAHQSDPDYWDFCGVQGDLFVGDEAQSPERYILPDGTIAHRGQVSVVFGMQQKTKVRDGIQKKLDAVVHAISLDDRIIGKARLHGIDPETVNYAPPEEKAEENDRVA